MNEASAAPVGLGAVGSIERVGEHTSTGEAKKACVADMSGLQVCLSVILYAGLVFHVDCVCKTTARGACGGGGGGVPTNDSSEKCEVYLRALAGAESW